MFGIGGAFWGLLIGLVAYAVLNGRFKGGYITRHYGQPAQQVQAIQLEMAQLLYMQEDAPFGYLPERAAQVQPLLQAMLEAALRALVTQR